MSKDDVIKNAKLAKERWEDLQDKELKIAFRKNFHIRPTSEGITLVSTHPDKPMNGNKAVKIRRKAQYFFDEEFIRKCVNLKSNSDEWKKIGITKGDKGPEAHLQAWLINVINNCENKYDKELFELKKALNVKDVYFIGSELIFQEEKTKRRSKT